ncbi:Pentatricopeptide repeat-containing protein [Cynara cardunculus var. scolymus]|uniref:Pentatricopeptide repeat-containing protein n=1 Tax=Cynara cardunculus var. scolymus TaxID=59895 RepID=A0A103XW82_CYNCS|nr:Pentatricopeptide repeat-containing protein [Cynara cardunculus var. scolymus]
MSSFMLSLSSILRRSIPPTVLSHARQTHVQILIHGLIHDATLQTDLLLAYSKGSLLYARKVFDKMLERNMHSWNIMISGYVRKSMHRDALSVFDEFLNSGLKPDHYTLPLVLKICAGIGDVLLGVMLHGMVVKLGFENCVVVSTSVLDFYSKCGKLNDARIVFVGLSWKDSVVWNSMISGFAKAGLHLEALDCFRNMLGNKAELDSMTVPTLLNVCGKLGDVTKGKEIHGQVLKNTVLHKDTAIGNSLIDLYSKCGYLCDAEKIFLSLRNRNLVTWTTLISCYGFHGNGKESLRLFEKMKDSGFKPNSVTLTAILASCSHSGLIDQGKKIFNSIRSSYRFEPTVEHYACMVDLLSRFGWFNEAIVLIRSMKTVPPASVWGALLAGSLVHRNVETGEMAARHLFEIEPTNASNYIALCGIYDSRGMWSDVSRVRSEMKRSGFGKTPGCSWISIGGEIRTFYQGDFHSSLGHKINETFEGIIGTLLLT